MNSQSQPRRSRRSAGRTYSRPEIFVDRCLGGDAVPQVFRAAGYAVTALHEAFGPTKVADEVWIEWAAARGMVAVTKDKRIRTRPHERSAFEDAGLRVLCLSSGNLTSRAQAEVFEVNVNRLDRLWRVEGPWLYSVSMSGLRRLI